MAIPAQISHMAERRAVQVRSTSRGALLAALERSTIAAASCGIVEPTPKESRPHGAGQEENFAALGNQLNILHAQPGPSRNAS